VEYNLQCNSKFYEDKVTLQPLFFYKNDKTHSLQIYHEIFKTKIHNLHSLLIIYFQSICLWNILVFYLFKKNIYLSIEDFPPPLKEIFADTSHKLSLSTKHSV
jgi:hypothetical protein